MSDRRFCGRLGMCLAIGGPIASLAVASVGTPLAGLAAGLIALLSFLSALVLGWIGADYLSGKVAIAAPFLLGLAVWCNLPKEAPAQSLAPTTQSAPSD